MFFGPSAFQLRSKIHKKASPGRSKIKQKIGQHLDRIFDASWSQLGSILEGFWRPSWNQVATKWFQNSIPKTVKKSSLFGSPPDGFLVDFGSQHASQEGAPEIDFRRFFASWGLLGAKMAPRPPQTPPRGLLGAILNQFSFHFV